MYDLFEHFVINKNVDYNIHLYCVVLNVSDLVIEFSRNVAVYCCYLYELIESSNMTSST